MKRSILDRINFWTIVSKHINETLYDYGVYKITGKKKIPKSDIIIFLFVPIFLSISFYFLGIRITNGNISVLVTSLSIFTGLLFGLLTMVFGQLNNYKTSDIKDDIRLGITKELFINVAFSILLSILSIIFIFMTQFDSKYINIQFDWIKKIFLFLAHSISYFLLIEFLFILLMILKRFFLLFLYLFKDK